MVHGRARSNGPVYFKLDRLVLTIVEDLTFGYVDQTINEYERL